MGCILEAYIRRGERVETFSFVWQFSEGRGVVLMQEGIGDREWCGVWTGFLANWSFQNDLMRRRSLPSCT